MIKYEIKIIAPGFVKITNIYSGERFYTDMISALFIRNGYFV